MLWVDGRLVTRDRWLLPEGETGLGLFETLRVENGQPILWARHLERLAESAKDLGFEYPPPPHALARGLKELLAAQDLVDAAARITWMGGAKDSAPSTPRCWIEAQALDSRIWPGVRTGAARAIFATRLHEPGPLARHKTTRRLPYQIANAEARAAGADEALLVTPAKSVLEGATSNVFWVAKGRVHTPPVRAGILPGIVRAAVLALCRELALPVHEREIARDELFGAEEIFVTNSIQEVVPLVEIAGQPIPSQAIGLKLKAGFRALVAR